MSSKKQPTKKSAKKQSDNKPDNASQLDLSPARAYRVPNLTEIYGGQIGALNNYGSQTNNFSGPRPEPLCPPLPSKPNPFSGREQELGTLFKLLADPRTEGQTVAITALYGTGGLGKTTLAKMLAHRLYEAGQFKVVIWADVTRTPDLVMLLETWARYGDRHYQAPRHIPAEKLLPVLRDEAKAYLTLAIKVACGCTPDRVLMVLDDVWDTTVANILREARPDGATVLITTRLDTLADDLGAQPQKLGFLEDHESAELLKSYLSDVPLSALYALGHALNGHPLALKLAAQRARKESKRAGQTLDKILHKHAGEYQTHLSTDMPFSRLKLEQGETKEDNLSKSLYYSYEALSQFDQANFRALGILARGTSFNLDLLAALWQLTRDEVEEKGCDPLREASLIDVADREGIYHLHPLLRAYAGALLNQASGYDPVFVRYADYIIQVAAQFEDLQPEFWGQLDSHLFHIHFVGDVLCQLYEANPEDTIWAQRLGDFTWNVKNYVHARPQMIATIRGQERRGFYWFKTALEIYEKQNDAERRATMLSSLGSLYSNLGDKEQALEYNNEALRASREIENKHIEAIVLHNIAKVWEEVGNRQEALSLYTQSLEISREIQDKSIEASDLNSLGGLWYAAGEKTKALSFLNESLEISRLLNDKEGQSTTLTNIGNIYNALGNREPALSHHSQALALAHLLGDKRGEARILNSIGLVYTDTADRQQALNYYNQALSLVRLVGDKGGEATTLYNMASVLSEIGRPRKALEIYDEALSIKRVIGDIDGEATILNSIGNVWYSLDQDRKALRFYEEALPLRRVVDDKLGEAATLNDMGSVWYALRDKQKALDLFNQALVLHQVVDHKAGEATTCFNIAAVYKDWGDLDKAIEYIERCVRLSEEMKRPEHDKYRQLLLDFRREKEKTAHTQQKSIVPFLTLYRTGGEKIVRQHMNAMGMPSAMIDTLIAHLKAGATSTNKLPIGKQRKRGH